MKTIKINEKTHKVLKIIKAYKGYKTLDETIDMAIVDFAYQEGIEDQIKDVY